MAGIASKLAKDRDAAQGLGSNAKAVKFFNQDFQALRDECLQAGKLFQDPSFPAAATSLGYNELGPKSYKTQGIAWKRPTVGDKGSQPAPRHWWEGVAEEKAGALHIGPAAGGLTCSLQCWFGLEGKQRSLEEVQLADKSEACCFGDRNDLRFLIPVPDLQMCQATPPSSRIRAVSLLSQIC